MISGGDLRAEREAAGVSAGAVAREWGVSRQYVSKIERYSVVLGDTLVLARAGIEAALAKKEGREPMKEVPAFCPVCSEPMKPNLGMNLVQHLNAKHPEREVIVQGASGGQMGAFIGARRRGYLVMEGPRTFGVVFTDYPFAVMTFPAETYRFEPTNVVDTPKETK